MTVLNETLKDGFQDRRFENMCNYMTFVYGCDLGGESEAKYIESKLTIYCINHINTWFC